MSNQKDLNKLFPCDCGNFFRFIGKNAKYNDFVCPNKHCRQTFYIFDHQIDEAMTNENTVRFGTGELTKYQHKQAIEGKWKQD